MLQKTTWLEKKIVKQVIPEFIVAGVNFNFKHSDYWFVTLFFL